MSTDTLDPREPVEAPLDMAESPEIPEHPAAAEALDVLADKAAAMAGDESVEFAPETQVAPRSVGINLKVIGIVGTEVEADALLAAGSPAAFKKAVGNQWRVYDNA